ncbi:MAG: phenylalanine--tRNA ligase subunit alpha [Ignisphaera sp.]
MHRCIQPNRFCSGASIIVLEVQLSKSEFDVLKKLVELNKPIELSELAKETELNLESLNSIVELLKSKGIVKVDEQSIYIGKTTEEGLSYIEALPEEKVAEYVKSRGGSATIDDIRNVLREPIASIGINWAVRRGWIRIERGVASLQNFTPLKRHKEILTQFSNAREIDENIKNDAVFQELVKRRLISISLSKRRIVRLAVPYEDAAKLVNKKPAVSKLTHDMLATGSWRNFILKAYNLDALPPTIYPGKKHFFKEFVNMIKDVMEDLGFEEINDDYIIPELWNFDILFQAQDHPSRDIHDILVVEGYADLSMFRDVVDRTRGVHETGGSCGSIGWRYKWSYEKASKLILRSHTTAVTARHLINRKPPARLYTISRVFRRDNPDPRHSPEFTNFDGVIMERGFNFRKLLGLLAQILRAIGIEKFRFKPAYFPFTEPSVEGYGYVPGYGWIEVFGAGMFRPEVLEILGVDTPVGAWGMGVERLAMVVYGIDDIRLLFSKDIEFTRTFPYVKRLYMR